MYICTAAGNNIYNTKVLYIYICTYIRNNHYNKQRTKVYSKSSLFISVR